MCVAYQGPINLDEESSLEGESNEETKTWVKMW